MHSNEKPRLLRKVEQKLPDGTTLKKTVEVDSDGTLKEPETMSLGQVVAEQERRKREAAARASGEAGRNVDKSTNVGSSQSGGSLGWGSPRDRKHKKDF